MIISIIAAVADDWVIGDKNDLPWHLPADFRYFKKQTSGKPIIMGQRTFESIGARPLSGRKNIILSQDKNYRSEGCFVAHNLEGALSLAKPAQEAMICGGASVYKQFLPLADRLYLTIIHYHFSGDTIFPAVDFNDWQEISRADCPADKENPFSYSFIVWERKIK